MAYINYIIFFIAAVFTKITDNLVDERLIAHKWLKFFTGFFYGAILGFLLSTSGFSALIIGTVMGNLFYGRFDNKAHQISLFSLLLFSALFGFPQIGIIIMAVFICAAWIDEFLNDNSKNLQLKQRPVLVISCLMVSVFTSNPVYFIAIAFFDVGYFLAEYGMEKFWKKFDAEYGTHLILDFYKCNSKELNSPEFVKGLLKKTVELLDMHPISDYVAFEYRAGKKIDSGVSGFVFITESHIAIHTYPMKNLAKIDVFSCKKFDVEKIENFLKKKFEAEESEKKFFDREKHYPKDMENCQKIIETTR